MAVGTERFLIHTPRTAVFRLLSAQGTFISGQFVGANKVALQAKLLSNATVTSCEIFCSLKQPRGNKPVGRASA